jgi:hypothetical protein
MSSGGLKDWLPNERVARFLLAWIIGTSIFVFAVVPWWARQHRDTTCSRPQANRPVADAAWLGEPDSSARLSPKLDLTRGVAEDSVTWPVIAGAPDGVYRASSRSLLPEGGGRVVPSQAIQAWLEVDAGTALLTVCVDSSKLSLDHGTYAGFAFVPTSDPTKTLTVREELSVQSTYTGSFWPIGAIMVGLAIALGGEKLASASKPVKWVALATGLGAFGAAYYANALSNPTWGGLEAVGTLIVTTFTATVGATTAAAATTSNK